MKVFAYTLYTDLKRLVFSKPFFGALLAYILVSFFTLAQEAPGFHDGTSIMYVRMIQEYLGFYIVYVLFAAVSCAPVFCVDWENRFYRYSVVRSSSNIYSVSKALSCFLSSFLFIFIAEWLQILILHCMNLPLTGPQFENNLGVFDVFSKPDKILIYFLLTILLKSLNASFLSVLALCVSSKIPNIFVALAAPILSYEILNTVANAFRLPGHFVLRKISLGQININDSFAQSFFYCVGVYIVLTAICMVLFVKGCKRRIQYG